MYESFANVEALLNLKNLSLNIKFNIIHACIISYFSCVRLFVTLWTIAYQAPLSMGIMQARILEWVDIPSSKERYISVYMMQRHHMWSSYGTCRHVCVCEESSDKWRNKTSKKESKNGILVSQRKKITGELAVWSGQSEDSSLLNKVLLYLWVLMGTAKESLCLVEEEYTKGGMQGQQKVTNSYTWNQDIAYYTQQPAQEIMYSIIESYQTMRTELI